MKNQKYIQQNNRVVRLFVFICASFIFANIAAAQNQDRNFPNCEINLPSII
jgi:hypothetical protein